MTKDELITLLDSHDHTMVSSKTFSLILNATKTVLNLSDADLAKKFKVSMFTINRWLTYQSAPYGKGRLNILTLINNDMINNTK